MTTVVVAVLITAAVSVAVGYLLRKIVGEARINSRRSRGETHH